MTLERITDGQDADGYLTLSAHVEGAYGLRLAGSFDAQRKFTLSSTSEPVLYSSIYRFAVRLGGIPL